jgi:hypothetical protein
MISLAVGSRKSEASWTALLAISNVMDSGWTLVGGQMVHLHCAERGHYPTRPTDDIDTIVNIRTRPRALFEFTEAMANIGMRPVDISADGHQHRWTNNHGAQIDVLQPTGLGDRLRTTLGFSGSTTVSTPAAQQALDRSQRVEVCLGSGETGTINRPNLLGALVVKSAALTTTSGERTRHIIDLAILATLVTSPRDIHGMTARDERYLRQALQTLRTRPDLTSTVSGATAAVPILGAYVEQNRRRRELAGNTRYNSPPTLIQPSTPTANNRRSPKCQARLTLTWSDGKRTSVRCKEDAHHHGPHNFGKYNAQATTATMS